MELPADLRAALDAELAAIPTQRLARATAALVERYRGRRAAASASFVASDDDVAAYAAYRMPATFAAIYAALAQTRLQWAAGEPRTLLDAGAGPGTAAWAAHAVWPTIGRISLLERDARMLAFGRRLASRARAAAIREARWQHADLLSPEETQAADLVVAAYVLNELPAEQRPAVIAQLWEQATLSLVLVEPGTPAGFAVIREARAQLIAAGGSVLAPCPHDDVCPLPAGDWCHFAQRINRTRLQRTLKGAILPYEDEKFSYVAIARQPGWAIAGRVIRHPQIQPGRITLQLCAPEGLSTITVTRGKNHDAFRQARNLAWGNALPDENLDDQRERKPDVDR